MTITSENLEELLRFATAIGSRYMGADRAGQFGRRNAMPGWAGRSGSAEGLHAPHAGV